MRYLFAAYLALASMSLFAADAVYPDWPKHLAVVPPIPPQGTLCWTLDDTHSYGNCVTQNATTKVWQWASASQFAYALSNHRIVTVPKPAAYN